jgi:hypothetical protein
MKRRQTRIEKLQAIVGASYVKTDFDSLANWASDATRQYAPAATAIVFPSSSEEVQAIVKLAILPGQSHQKSFTINDLKKGVVNA